MIQDCIEVFEIDRMGAPTAKLLGYAPIQPDNPRDCASAMAANWLLRNSRPKVKVLITTHSTFSSMVAPVLTTMVVEFDSEEEAQRAISNIKKADGGTNIRQAAIKL